MPQIQDRIIDLRRLPPGDLHPHPENWRTHGSDQTEGMAAMLEDVGMATAVVAYEDEEWGLTLIDGHLRAGMDTDVVPVLVLDVDREEARKLLATMDPLAAMAGTDPAALASILAGVESEEEQVSSLVFDIQERYGLGMLELPTQETAADYNDNAEERAAEAAARTESRSGSITAVMFYIERDYRDTLNRHVVGLKSAWALDEIGQVITEALKRGYEGEVADAAD